YHTLSLHDALPILQTSACINMDITSGKNVTQVCIAASGDVDISRFSRQLRPTTHDKLPGINSDITCRALEVASLIDHALCGNNEVIRRSDRATQHYLFVGRQCQRTGFYQ